MIITQIASKSFIGFMEGLNALRDIVKSVDHALSNAEQKIPKGEMPYGFEGDDSISLEGRWSVALTLQALCSGGQSNSIRVTHGSVLYRTVSGLEFGWARLNMEEGYFFRVKHPSGAFPEGSTLLDALKGARWDIFTYHDGVNQD